MKKILLGILLLFISFGGYSQNPAKFKDGIELKPINAPSTPNKGTIYFDLAQDIFFGWNGTKWLNLSSEHEILIDGYWVDKKLNSDESNIEVGDQIRGNFASDNYIIANVLSLPHTFKPNLDLFIDNYLDEFTIAFGSVKFGYLYNWYTLDDSRELSNTGWSFPSTSDFTTLESFLGGSGVAGGKLKETGTIYWDTESGGTTNESNYNSRGAGIRDNGGSFNGLKANGVLWIDTGVLNAPGHFDITSTIDISSIITGGVPGDLRNRTGYSIRFIKDTTTLSNGETSTYTGNDGKVYRTICIGTQEWVADNLIETKYRNGDLIPEVTNDISWAGLSTGARCSYDNDESNAF